MGQEPRGQGPYRVEPRGQRPSLGPKKSAVRGMGRPMRPFWVSGLVLAPGAQAQPTRLGEKFAWIPTTKIKTDPQGSLASKTEKMSDKAIRIN